jgi:predicted O-methyltransferase YrrM
VTPVIDAGGAMPAAAESSRRAVRTLPAVSLGTTLSAYRDSLAVARRIRSLPAGISSADAFAFNQREQAISANQKDEEIVWLLDVLRAERPRTVLEIGTHFGGTLFLFSRVVAPDALLVSVDMQPMVGRVGRYSPYALIRHSFARDRQRVELIDAVNSQDAATVDRVRDVLCAREVDFLFIDGDHSYEGVRRDFELYAPLVRAGGLVGFHDVSRRSTPHTEGVARLWSMIKANHETQECVADRGDDGYGIGVYRVRDESEVERFLTASR